MDLPPTPDPRAAEAARLAVRVEELERRLQARTLELETEARAAERHQRRADEMSRRMGELEKTTAVFHRAAVETTVRSRPAPVAAPKSRDSELKDARLQIQALRRKADGHEAHIDSLRAELDQAREEIRALRQGAPSPAEEAPRPETREEPRAPLDDFGAGPSQAVDEARLLRWLLVAAGIVALAAASVLLVRG